MTAGQRDHASLDDGRKPKERNDRTPEARIADAAFAPLARMQRLIARDGAVAWYGRLLSHPVDTYRDDTARRKERKAGRDRSKEGRVAR